MKPYHRNDNKLHEHDKFQAAGLSAVGLWTMCRSWAADNWTDGFVPSYAAKRFAERGIRVRQAAARLVEVGLWEEVEGGWQFHDWADWNTTRAERDAANEAAAERMRAARAKRNSTTSTPPLHHLDTTSAPPRHHLTPEPAGQTEMFARTPEQEVRTRTRTQGTTSLVHAAVTTDVAVPVRRRDAGTLIAEWMDLCAVKPPTRVVGHLAREIRQLLDEYPYDLVREAVLAWNGRGLGPGQLPHVLNGIVNPPTRPTWGENKRGSTTDQIFLDGAGVMARAAERDRHATQREITNEPEGPVRNPGNVSRAF